jgi:hypothetical protein
VAPGPASKPAAAPASTAPPSSGTAAGRARVGKAPAAPLSLDLEGDLLDSPPPPTVRPPEPARPHATPIVTRPSRPQMAAVQVPVAPAAALPSDDDWDMPSPPTRKMQVPDALLKASTPPPAKALAEMPEFADLSEAARTEFFEGAKRRTLSAGDFARGFALVAVLRGEAELVGASSDRPVARLQAGAVLRARGTVGKSIPVRLIAHAEGCDVATWGESPVLSTFQTCPWVDTALRTSANRLLSLVGASSGPLGRLENSVIGELAAWWTPRVLTAGEVLTHEGETAPALVVVGLGIIEPVVEGKAGKPLSVGDIVDPAGSLKGGRSTTQFRAGPEGALALVVDKTRRQQLHEALPSLLALLQTLLSRRDTRDVRTQEALRSRRAPRRRARGGPARPPARAAGGPRGRGQRRAPDRGRERVAGRAAGHLAALPAVRGDSPGRRARRPGGRRAAAAAHPPALPALRRPPRGLFPHRDASAQLSSPGWTLYHPVASC